MGLMMIRLVVMAKVLSVEEYGFFSKGLLVANTFSMLSCLGFQLLLQRDLPHYFFVGLNKRAAVMITQAVIIATGLFFFLFAGLWACTICYSIGAVVFVGLFNGLSQQILIISTVESRSRGDMLRYAKDILIRAIAVTFIGCWFGWVFDSAIIALFTDGVLTLIFCWTSIRFTYPNKKYLFESVALGFKSLKKIKWTTCAVFFINNGLGFFIINTDRWVASLTLTLDSFGLYSFVGILFLIGSSIQALISASLFPYLLRIKSLSGSGFAFLKIFKIIITLIILLLIINIPIFLFNELLLQKYFISYIEAVNLVPIFLLIAIIRSCDYWSIYLIAIGKEKIIFYISLFTIIIMVTFYYIMNEIIHVNKILVISYINLFITILLFLLGGVFSYRYKGD